MKQSIVSLLLKGIFVLLLTVGSARADTIQRQHFLDWDYVMTVWTTMKTLDEASSSVFIVVQTVIT